ncbi:hypothetical protein Golob_010553 [Gossypium lobatum]|uniref:Uncharacterized protein n=1 Tax=Gossypium lobatum TaxID=34289 RepID=A0A7J8MLR9_9ROSI|nr:hypothetical protein [Gossypium lobatum]
MKLLNLFFMLAMVMALAAITLSASTSENSDHRLADSRMATSFGGAARYPTRSTVEDATITVVKAARVYMGCAVTHKIGCSSFGYDELSVLHKLKEIEFPFIIDLEYCVYQ